MSTAPGNLTFNARRPLQEQPFNISHPAKDSVTAKIETPVARKTVMKMTTPPESTLPKKSLPFETPVPRKHSNAMHSHHHHPMNINTNSIPNNLHHAPPVGGYTKFDPSIASVNNPEPSSQHSALLSPAFSSPQNRLKYADPASSPGCINPSSSLSVDASAPKTVKKTKKSKKESKETAFDLDSEEKPPYSYATLIGISILSHPDKRLPLSQIYQWISETFKYYKREDVGWQNSIRHNLSLNKAFVKGEKSKDGKGHFWCIKEGFEEQFLKSRSVKKSSYHEVMDQINLNKSSHREETKRNMNALPSSPNVENNEPKPFGANRNYSYTNDQVVSAPRKRKRTNYNESEEESEYNEEEDDNDEEGDLTHILDPPVKRQHTDRLGEPFGPWDPVRTSISLEARTQPPQLIVTESPNKPLLAGKSLTYTSSFSCNSNLELSPIRPSQTGPLLEPLTPANNVYQNHQFQHLHTTISSGLASATHHSILGLQRPGSALNHANTPKANVLKTPLRNLRTPQTNSIMKKLWNSPSYLDEFYYSPLINSHSIMNNIAVHGLLNSYDDDDMLIRSFENHPQNHPSPMLSRKSGSTTSINSTIIDSSRNLFNDFKKIDVLSSVSSKSDTDTEEDLTKKSNHSRQVSSTSTEADD